MHRVCRDLTRSGVATAILLVLVVAAAGAQFGGGARRATRASAKPAAVVDELYRHHFAHDQEFESTFNTRKVDFAPALREALERSFRAQAANPGELVGLDFNPLTNAQEMATGYEIGATTSDGDDAIVAVAIRFGSETVTVRMRLARDAGAWRIRNVHYAEGDLMAILGEL